MRIKPEDLDLPKRLTREQRARVYWTISKGLNDMRARRQIIEDESKSFMGMSRVMWSFGFTGKILVIGLWAVGLMVAAAVLAEIMLWGALTQRWIELSTAQ